MQEVFRVGELLDNPAPLILQFYVEAHAGCRSRGERAAAAAASRGLRILENESLAHEGLFEIKRDIRQVERTLRIDKDASAIFLDDVVAVAGLGFEAHGVRESRAAASLDTNAEASRVRRDAFFGEQLADFLRRFFGYMNHIFKTGGIKPPLQNREADSSSSR